MFYLFTIIIISRFPQNFQQLEPEIFAPACFFALGEKEPILKLIQKDLPRIHDLFSKADDAILKLQNEDGVSPQLLADKIAARVYIYTFFFFF